MKIIQRPGLIEVGQDLHLCVFITFLRWSRLIPKCVCTRARARARRHACHSDCLFTHLLTHSLLGNGMKQWSSNFILCQNCLEGWLKQTAGSHQPPDFVVQEVWGEALVSASLTSSQRRLLLPCVGNTGEDEHRGSHPCLHPGLTRDAVLKHWCQASPPEILI